MDLKQKYIRDKALKVISSCKTKQQTENAEKYIKLLRNIYGDIC